jgi:hypothetical protein
MKNHKNYKQEHEMCKISMKTYLYYVNICKHEHEKTWQGYNVKSCLRLMLNILNEMKNPTFIYTPLVT